MTENGSYRSILANDPEVLEQLIKTYADPLIRYAYCIVQNADLAEEIMEDAFASLIYRRRHFTSLEQIRAWLYKAVRSKAIDQLRKPRCVPLEDLEEVLSSGDLESDILKKERNRTVYTCIQGLPAQYRDVLVLSFFEGFSVMQICKILGKNTKQVYNLQTRAKASLKESLIKEGYTHEEL